MERGSLSAEQRMRPELPGAERMTEDPEMRETPEDLMVVFVREEMEEDVVDVRERDVVEAEIPCVEETESDESPAWALNVPAPVR